MKPRMVLTALALASVCVSLLARSETQSRTIYVSVVDKKGAAVTDLSPADLEVSEAGKAQTPVKIERATTPMSVAIVVDDRGLGLPEARESLSAFVSALSGRATIGLFSSSRPEWTLVDFTQNSQQLLDGIQGLVRMQSAGAGLEPLTYDLAHRLQEQAPARPIILTVSVDQGCPGTMASAATANNCQPAWLQPGAIIGGNWPQTVAEVQRSRATYYAIVDRHVGPGDHNPIIDMSAEVTGGRVDPVLTDSGVAAAMTRITDDILGQYAVTYNGAAAPKDGAKLQVRVKRQGLTVRAPDRVGVR